MLYERLGAQRPPSERQKLDRWLLPLRNGVGDQVVAATWAEGRALEFEDAVALALGTDEVETSQPVAPVSDAASAKLTAREREVARLLARGLTNRQIAERLVITERTVAAHVEHLLNKLGFASRHQVGVWAADHGLLS
jgi:DNA-binding NarL/FixJ family response regulator